MRNKEKQQKERREIALQISDSSEMASKVLHLIHFGNPAS